MSGGKIALLGRNMPLGILYHIPPQKKNTTLHQISHRNIEIHRNCKEDATLAMLSFLPSCMCMLTTVFAHSFFSPRLLSDLIQQSGWVCPVDTLVIALNVRDVQ